MMFSNKYLSPKNYGVFALRKLNVGLFQCVETFFAPSSRQPLKFPPIFIIGAPRSGSTLLYQSLVEYFDIGFLSNLHCRFFGAPSVVERLLKPAKWNRNPTFHSEHGRVEGLFSPSECGEYWYRFFRRKPQYVSGNDISQQKIENIRSSVKALVSSVNKPVLFKNMNCALRLIPLYKAVPEALFIVTDRDLVDNAISLLNVRRKVYGTYDKWWSMEPPEIDEFIKMPFYKQVVEQVRSINELIDANSQKIGEDRFVYVKYEEFCKDVYGAMGDIEKFLNFHRVNIKRKDCFLPNSFEQRSPCIELSVRDKIEGYLCTR